MLTRVVSGQEHVLSMSPPPEDNVTNVVPAWGQRHPFMYTYIEKFSTQLEAQQSYTIMGKCHSQLLASVNLGSSHCETQCLRAAVIVAFSIYKTVMRFDPPFSPLPLSLLFPPLSELAHGNVVCCLCHTYLLKFA